MSVPRSLLLAAAAVLFPSAPAAIAGPGDWLLDGVRAAVRQGDSENPRTVTRTISVDDVDVATLLGRLEYVGLELPFEATGTISAALTGTLNLGRITDSSAQVLEGRISSPRLTVAGLTVTELSAALTYRGGDLTLDELNFRVPPPAPAKDAAKRPAEDAGTGTAKRLPAGTVTGSAKITDVPDGLFTAELTVDGVPLAVLLPRLGVPALVSGGSASGTVSARVPAPKIRDAAAWDATGDLTLRGVDLAGRTLETAAAELTLKENRFTLADLAAVIEGHGVTGGAGVTLDAPFPFTAKLQLPGADAADLGRLLGELAPDLAATGRYAARVNATGTVDPLRYDARGALRGGPLTVEGVALRSLSADVAATPDAVSLTSLAADLGTAENPGGSLAGSVKVGLTGAQKFSADLTLDAVDLAALPPLAEATGGPVAGTVTGDLKVSGSRDPLELVAAGTLDGKALTVLGVTAETLAARVVTDGDRLLLKDLTAAVGGGTVAGSAAVSVDAISGAGDGAFRADLTADNIDLAQLPALADRLGTPLAGTVRGSAKVRGTRDPFDLTGTADVSADGLTAFGTTAKQFAAKISADEDAVRLTGLNAAVGDGRVAGTATVGLAGNRPFAADLAVTDLNLADFPALAELTGPDAAPPAGTVDATFTARGTRDPFDLTAADGRVAARGLTAYGTTVEEFAANISADGDAVDLSDLTAVVGDGRVTGSARVGLAGDRPFTADLAVADLNLADLPALAEFAPAGEPPPAGVVDATLAARGTLDPAALLAADGRVSARDVAAFGVTANSFTAKISADEGEARLTDLSAELGGGTLAGTATVGLGDAGRFSADVLARGLDLELLPVVGATLGTSVAGRVNAKLVARGTREPLRVEAAGAVAAAGLSAHGVTMDTLTAAFRADGDTVTLTSFTAAVGGGTVRGDGRVGLAADRPFAADLAVDGVDLSELPGLAGRLGVPVAGRVRADVTASGTLEPVRVTADGTVAGQRLSVGDTVLDGASAKISADGPDVRLTELRLVSDGSAVSGTASLNLDPPRAWSADLTVGSMALSKLDPVLAAAGRAERLTGVVNARVRAGGRLSEGTYAAAGSAAGAGVGVLGLPGTDPGAAVAVENFAVTFTASPDRLTVPSLRGGVFGGTLAASADLPLAGNAPGSAKLAVRGLRPGSVAAQFAGVTTEDVGGAADLAAALTLPASGPPAAQVRVTGDGLTVRGKAVEEAAATLRVAGGAGSLTASGRWLGGSFAVDGRLGGALLRGAGDTPAYEPPAVPSDEVDPLWTAAGTVKVDGVRLGEARRALPELFGDADLRGAAGVDLAFRLREGMLPGDVLAGQAGDADAGEPLVTGSVRLVDVRLGDDLLSERTEGAVSVDPAGAWAVKGLRGRYGGGTFRASIVPGRDGGAAVEVTLRRADASRALAPVEWLSENVAGQLSLRATGTLEETWRFRSRGELSRGELLGVLPVDGVQLPVELIYAPATGAGEVRLRGTAARIAGGRTKGNVRVTFNAARPGVGVDVDLAVSGAHFRKLAGGGVPGGSAIDRVDARVELDGRSVRGLEDLEGRVVASFRGAQVRSLPVIGAAVPFLSLPSGAEGRTGEFRGFLRRGVLRVERFSLTGDRLALFAEGTVDASTGRLDLDVIADTGRRDADAAVLLLLAEQAVELTTPVGFVLRANRLLSDRVIYLKVTGTLDRPTVRPEPGKQLREEAVRFFINSLVPTLGVGGAAGAAAEAAAGP